MSRQAVTAGTRTVVTRQRLEYSVGSLSAVNGDGIIDCVDTIDQTTDWTPYLHSNNLYSIIIQGSNTIYAFYVLTSHLAIIVPDYDGETNDYLTYKIYTNTNRSAASGRTAL